MEALDLQKNVEIFSRKSIQRIINYQWKNWQNTFYFKMFIPYLLLLICFNFLHYITDFNLPFLETKLGYGILWTMIAITTILPVYFLILEGMLLYKKPKKYCSTILGMFRVSPQICLLVLDAELILHRLKDDSGEILPEKTSDYLSYIICITNMLLWFNFFLLLRYIKYTAYLVQMIIEVFKDIKVFLVILVISIFAFTSSF